MFPAKQVVNNGITQKPKKGLYF